MRSDLGLVVLENTHNFAGGTVAGRRAHGTTRSPPPTTRACPSTWTGPASGTRPLRSARRLASLVAGADTAMVTLSKGLCAPAGSVLVSSRDHIEEARRVRKQLGGGMRQVGILAAAGLVGVETMVDRLAEDHANAALLAAGAFGVRAACACGRRRTNIVVAELAERSAPDLAADLAGRGVLISVMDARTIRLVTHHDVNGDACARAAAVLLEVLKGQ